ncbi:hypothetical protein ACIA5D_09990 [Actinoplanes sp. NPDC051513]|uniref:hypothetical protein n=1 Tax=Actinoplanes sp. NPDC051513 TaxID=3363908 RepID=UPI0037A90FFF
MTAVRDRPGARTGTYRAGSGTARARLVISALSLFAFALGLVGFLLGLHGPRVVGFVAYFLFGVGAAPWALFPRLELPLRLALSIGAAFATLVIVSTAMLETGLWQTFVATALVCAVTVPLHIAGLLRVRLERLSPPALGPGELAGGTGALICLISALAHRHTDPGLWGFLVRIGPLWYIGLGLIVLSLAIGRSRAIGVLALVLVLTGTPAIVYDMPRIQSAAKHVELVEQIRHQHLLQSSVDVYNGWPGFFSAMAWTSDAAGIRDSIHLATAWQLLIGLYGVVAARWLAGQVIRDRGLVWTAVVFCVLPNTIGQDYFSPQSVGYVLGVLIFGFALSDLPLRHKVPAMAVTGVTIAITHQLSPYIVGGALCLLVVLRRLRPWWLPATVLGTAALWALVNWKDLNGFVSLSDLGSSGNLTTPTPTTSSGLSRLPVFLATEAALVLSLLILSALALVVVWRERRSLSTWALVACPGAGLAIVVAHPYGKEGLYRAVLFAIPWLAVLAAQTLPRIAQLAVVTVLTANFLVGTFALDASNVMRQGDRDAFQVFAKTPTEGAVNYCLIIGPGDVPSGPITGPLTHLSVYRGDVDTTDGFTIATTPNSGMVDTLTGALIDYSGSNDPTDRLFAFWSPTSSYYGWEYGLHTPARFAALRDDFSNSPLWKVVYSEGGSVLFEYTGA